jgi:hypothetical protein
MATEPMRLNLEIEPDSEPIAGRIGVGEQAPRPFVGWAGLAALLTDILDADVESAGEARADRA